MEVDCIGVAADAAGLDERIRYHAPGEAGTAATAEIVADAVAMADRTAEHDTDVSTGRPQPRTPVRGPRRSRR